MPLTYYALDNEFAAATGDNVGTGGNSSTFDNPPQASLDLVITANEGDSDPTLFEVGDTYDVTFGGIGGGTLEDAVVVRSDAAPGGGGIIVFSGADENGDLVEVIWTPDFDIEGWYKDNYTPEAEPGFYTVDTDATYSHVVPCFAGLTRVRVPGGTRSVANLRAGDWVITQDDGAKRLLWTGARRVCGIGAAAPVLFEPGAIGNHSRLRLSQQHRVMLRSSRSEFLFGAREVFVPAKALINGGDIRLTPCPAITWVHLLLKAHQVLIAEGAPCESLLLGDMALDIITQEDRISGSLKRADQDMVAARPVLSFQEARFLICEMGQVGGRGEASLLTMPARSGVRLPLQAA